MATKYVLTSKGDLDNYIEVEIPENNKIPSIQPRIAGASSEEVHITAIPQVMLNVEDEDGGIVKHRTPYDLRAGESLSSIDIIDPDDGTIGECKFTSLFRIYAKHDDNTQEKVTVVAYKKIKLDKQEGASKETLAEASVFEDVDRMSENFAIIQKAEDGNYIVDIEHVIKTVGNPRYVQLNFAQISGMSLATWNADKKQFDEQVTAGNVVESTIILDKNSNKAKGLSRWSIPYTFEGVSGLIHFWTPIPYASSAELSEDVSAVMSSPVGYTEYQGVPIDISNDKIQISSCNIRGSQLLIMTAFHALKDNIYINAPTREIAEEQIRAAIHGGEASFPIEVVIAEDTGVMHRQQRQVIVHYEILNRPPAIQLVSPVQIRALSLGEKILTKGSGFDTRLSPNDKIRMQSLEEKTIVFTQGLNSLLEAVTSLKKSVDDYSENHGNPGDLN